MPILTRRHLIALAAVGLLCLLTGLYLAVTDYPYTVTPSEDGPVVETHGVRLDTAYFIWRDGYGVHVEGTDLGSLMGGE